MNPYASCVIGMGKNDNFRLKSNALVLPFEKRLCDPQVLELLVVFVWRGLASCGFDESFRWVWRCGQLHVEGGSVYAGRPFLATAAGCLCGHNKKKTD
ncbi:hypothetical protein [Halomonas sp. E14]|uniref:hypothetical protein n=1 Tax=Halomonas sp. E14 TaxID=3397245 RepID=UPI00403EAC5A